MPTKKKFDEIVGKYQPDGWKVRQVKRVPGGDCAGIAIWNKKTIYTKPVKDLRTLQVYLHEAAHVHLNHLGLPVRKPMMVEEYEAEMWSFAALVNEGIPVTSQMISDAKNNVRTHMDPGLPAAVDWVKR